MKHQVSRELHAYWDQLRGARTAPERGDVDPSAIRSILADTFLLEVERGASYDHRKIVVRLSGTRVNALRGGDLEGRSLVSLFGPEDEQTLGAILDLVLEDRIPVVAGAFGLYGTGSKVECEMLLLPLRHHGRTHARLLGSLVGLEPVGPVRLRPTGGLSLTTFRGVAHQPGVRLPGIPSLPAGRLGLAVRYGRFVVHAGGRQDPAQRFDLLGLL